MAAGSNGLDWARQNLARLGISESDAMSGFMKRGMSQSDKLAMDHFREQKKAYDHAQKQAQAAETAASLGVSGADLSGIDYGASVNLNKQGDSLEVRDAAGNKLTQMGFHTSPAAYQDFLFNYDVDPESLSSALDGANRTAVSNPSVGNAINTALSGYQRNPLLAAGDQFLNPFSDYLNNDDSYKLPERGSSYQPFTDISFANDASLSAANSLARTHPEYQKLQTAWWNHAHLNEGNTGLFNDNIDTSGIQFAYAGNAAGGELRGNGFAGTGYEAGRVPTYQGSETPSQTNSWAGPFSAPSPTQSAAPRYQSPFQNIFSSQDTAEQSAFSPWKTDFNKSSVLPPVYQPRSNWNGAPSAWDQSNPFKVRTF